MMVTERNCLYTAGSFCGAGANTPERLHTLFQLCVFGLESVGVCHGAAILGCVLEPVNEWTWVAMNLIENPAKSRLT
jgi:hypothetical protein